jgi:LytR cell envelope-related transcriptional attenuator
MGTSTLRAIILVAAVVLGVVVLKKAFPFNASQDVVTARPKVHVSPSPSVSPTPSRPSPTPSISPQITGVTVKVLNGTSKVGLATSTTQTLQSAGYKVQLPGDQRPAIAATIVYYKSAFKNAATYLQQHYFPRAQLKVAPTSLSSTADVTVILGSDFISPSSSP